MESAASFARLKQQFRITEIAAWTLVSILVTLIQSDLLEVPSRSFLYVTFACFLGAVLWLHHGWVKRIAIKKCFVIESFAFLIFASVLVHFTGDARSPFWLFYYMPIMISLMALDANFCLWILSSIGLINLVEMLRAFMSGDAQRLPILILNVFSLAALTALGYFLAQLLVQEKTLKDQALKVRDDALIERDQHLRSLEEKTREVEEFSARLVEVNQELMSQQTQLLHVTEALERANRELRKMDEIKSDFVSMVSHELKTPLTAIKESVALLHEEKSDLSAQERHKFLDITQNNVERLSRLIQDVLDFSKLESGTMKIKKAKVEICAAVHGIEQAFTRLVKEKGIGLKFSLPHELMYVYADTGRLRQILDNLVGNAFKFTPVKGVIELGVRSMKRGDVLKSMREWNADMEIFNLQQMAQISFWKDFIIFWVRDTGVGIPKKDANRIFEKFFQLDIQESRPKGTGLGLAIVKQLVVAHQGALWVESSVGQGTTFLIAFPIYDEVNKILDFMNEWIKKIWEAQGQAALILLDFTDSRAGEVDWQERSLGMEELWQFLGTLCDSKTESVLQLNGLQFLILKVGGERLEPLKIVEKIRVGIQESSLKDWGKGLRFSCKSLLDPRLNMEDLVKDFEDLSLEVNRDR